MPDVTIRLKVLTDFIVNVVRQMRKPFLERYEAGLPRKPAWERYARMFAIEKGKPIEQASTAEIVRFLREKGVKTPTNLLKSYVDEYIRKAEGMRMPTSLTQAYYYRVRDTLERLSRTRWIYAMKLRNFSHRLSYLQRRVILPLLFSFLGLMFEGRAILRSIEEPFRRLISYLEDFDSVLEKAALGSAYLGGALSRNLVRSFVDLGIKFREIMGIFSIAAMRFSVLAEPFVDAIESAARAILSIAEDPRVQVSLTEVFEGVKRGIVSLVSFISDRVPDFINIATKLGDFAGETVRVIGGVGNRFMGMVAGLASELARLHVPYAGTVKESADLVGDLMRQLRSAPGGLAGLGYALVGFGAALAVIVPTAQMAMLAINTLTLALSSLGAVAETVSGAISSITAIPEAAGGNIEKISTFIAPIADKIASIAGGLPPDIFPFIIPRNIPGIGNISPGQVGTSALTEPITHHVDVNILNMDELAAEIARLVARYVDTMLPGGGG